MTRSGFFQRPAALFVALLVMAAAGQARAVPALQLDIVGGVYDPGTETVVAQGNSFTLLALATPTGNTSAADILGETYFISAAIVPPTAEDPDFDAGSFTINGITVDATDAGLIFGSPPTESADLPGHGIFATYYHEITFQFDAGDTTTTYNSQDNAGGALFDDAGAGSFYVAFDVDVSGLTPGRILHFDLYNTKVKKNGTITVDDFAPFSHDAESQAPTITPPVPDTGEIPEPMTATLLLAGLAAAFRLRRRRAA